MIRDKRTMYRIKEDPVHSISPSFPLQFETFERFPKEFYISSKFDKLELNFFSICKRSDHFFFFFFYLIFKRMINSYKIRRISSLRPRGERDFSKLRCFNSNTVPFNNWCSHEHNVNLTAARLRIEHNADT